MKDYIRFLASDKVVNNMKKLYPRHELNERIKFYYAEKLRLSALIIVVGIILSIAVDAKGGGVIEDGSRIRRNEYLKGDKNVTLQYEINGSGDGDEGISGEIDIVVEEKRYTDSEIRKFSEEVNKKLVDNILGDNKSLDHITNNLNFSNQIDGYPFTFTYRTDNPVLLNSSGVINREKLDDEGAEVNVTVNARYADYEEETTIGLMLYKPELTYEEQLEKYVRDAVDDENNRSINMDYFALPSSIDGKKVIFSEEGRNNGIYVVVFILVTAVAIYFAKDKDIEKEVTERNAQLKDEYSRFLNRFTLFYTAGMPIKSIWLKICREYEKERNRTGEIKYLYEEMIVTASMIADGAREIDAYEEFASRIAMPEYSAFISLIVQAVDKGKSDLAVVLKHEMDDAFYEKVNSSKKQLEEAGTKLLMPMFMMLLVVMIMIMFPAFCSFK